MADDRIVNVLLVDDDAAVRSELRRVLTSRPDITVVGEAASGRQAVRMVQMLSPDVVLMDTDLPGMDGFETTLEIMTKKATPIIMISPKEDEEKADKGFRAIEAGAVALLAMPSGTGASKGRREEEIVQTVRAMAEVRVVHRRGRRPSMTVPAPGKPAPPPPSTAAVVRAPSTTATVELVAIGASTGGPQTLQRILAGLTPSFPAPVVVVQHITPDFQESFVGWLAQASGMPVSLATNGQPLQKGRVYVAPHPFQMGIDRGRRIVLRDDPPESGLRPSVSYLFRSVAAVVPRRTAAVLLTGMGQDGAAELLELRSRGAVTIAQDEETSIVHGMPGEAIRLGAATYVMPPEEISGLLVQLSKPSTDDGARK